LANPARVQSLDISEKPRMKKKGLPEPIRQFDGPDRLRASYKGHPRPRNGGFPVSISVYASLLPSNSLLVEQGCTHKEGTA
jgi:hypothetical protein